MATETEPTTGLLDRIVEQRRRQLATMEAVKRETRVLAQLLSETYDSDDVSLSAAARAMGINKSYASSLVHKLRDGEL